MSDSTSALVAEKATRPDAISLRDLVVIGIVHTPDGPSVLLRSARGEIARVQTGQDIYGVKVTAIGDDQVLLTNWLGETQALRVAGS